MKWIACLLTLIVCMGTDTLHAQALVAHAAAPSTHWGLYVLVFGAALGTSNLTLLEWAKRQDPDGRIARIVELLMKTNEVLLDMQWLMGNLPTGHRTTVRTGLPAVAWRLLNAGVAPSKSTTAQIDEQSGMLQAWSEVDIDLVKLNGNEAEFRASEARAFIEAMNEEMSSTIFYGSMLTPQEFIGLSPRYSLTTAGNGSNVIKAGGSGSDNSSIWLIVWGQDTIHGIFPKGSTAGLQHTDKGQQIVYFGTGLGQTRMEALVDKFDWHAGIAVRDWRYAVRICNIDISDLIADSSPFSADLLKLMAKAWHRIPSFAMGSAAFYANRTIQEWLDIQARETVTTGGQLKYEVIDGKPITSFRGIPIRRCDALLQSEATVV